MKSIIIFLLIKIKVNQLIEIFFVNLNIKYLNNYEL